MLVAAGGAAAPERSGVIPKPGTWTGKTWQGKPVSLQISADGRRWQKFHATMVLMCNGSGTWKRNLPFNVWFSTGAWQPIQIQSGSSVSYMERTVNGKTQQGDPLYMWVKGTFHYTAGSGSTVSTYVRGMLQVNVKHSTKGECFLHHASDSSGWEARPSG